MQALLSEAAPASGWRWGEYVLQRLQRRLLRGSDPIEVEDRVFDLLVLLLAHRERALDRQEVITAIWGKRPVSDATLRQLVYKARRAVGDDGGHQATIATLYGRSVQWVAPVTCLSEPATERLVAPAAPLPALLAPPAADGPADGWPGSGADRRTLPDRRRANAVPGALPAERRVAAMLPAARRRATAGQRIAWLVAALVLVVAGAAAAWVLVRHAGPAGSPASAPGDDASAAPSSQPATLAVLPFKDLDPQPDQRYVSDGLTEELINRLARMPRLRVTAPTSSFALRDKAMDVREAARRLGVADVLEGSVQRSGGRWRVRVALVGARTGYQLWANEYDVDAGDLLGMEDRIAHSVTAALYPKLGLAVHTATRSPVAAAAHDYFLVGLQYLRRSDTVDINRAIAYFERAIQAEPDYVDAWNALATGYSGLRDYNPDEHPDTHYGDAMAAVNKALLLDPRSPDANALLGMLYMRHWQWRRAQAEYRRALQLDPNDAGAHQWYALYFWYVGDMQAALKQMYLARDLDPLSPIINADLGRALLFAGDVDGAIRQGQAAVTLAPDFSLAHLFLGEAWERKGRLADAIRETRAGIAATPSPPESDDLASLGRMEWEAGDRADALRLRDEVEARAKMHYVSGVALAYIEWAVGDKDRAFADLERAATDHDSLLMTVSGVRDRAWYADPRFAKLLVTMHLPVQSPNTSGG